VVRAWENLEAQKAHVGLSGWIVVVSWFVTIIFALMGVICDAANVKLGLTTGSWLLLAVIATVIGVQSAIFWATEWYLKTAA